MTICCRSGVVLIALSLFWGGMTAGCHQERKKTERLLTETVKSYDQLQPRLTELEATLGGMRKDVEAIAAKVPGGAELRAKYFNADEVTGVLDARMKWLSGKIESAKRNLKKGEVDSLQDTVAKTRDDMGQVSNVLIELTHERARMEGAGRRAFQSPLRTPVSTGYLVKAAANGMESHLIAFLEDANKKVDKTNWFDFDRLQFEGDSADLDFRGSLSQLENVAYILAAYPAVRLKIGGFADNVEVAEPLGPPPPAPSMKVAPRPRPPDRRRGCGRMRCPSPQDRTSAGQMLTGQSPRFTGVGAPRRAGKVERPPTPDHPCPCPRFPVPPALRAAHAAGYDPRQPDRLVGSRHGHGRPRTGHRPARRLPPGQAAGGVGLIIVQVAGVHDTARYTSHVLMATDDSCIDGYRRLVDAVAPFGTVLFGQLFHRPRGHGVPGRLAAGGGGAVQRPQRAVPRHAPGTGRRAGRGAGPAAGPVDGGVDDWFLSAVQTGGR